MSYPMEFNIEPELDYPYRFRFDLLYGGEPPKDQIPKLKNTVDTWLKEMEMDYTYRQGLLWCLKNEQDAMLFKLRFA